MKIWTAGEARAEFHRGNLPHDTLDYIHEKLDCAVSNRMWFYSIPLCGSMEKDVDNVMVYLQSLGYKVTQTRNSDNKVEVLVSL